MNQPESAMQQHFFQDIDFNELHIHDELLENLPKIFHKYNLDELSMSDIIFGKHFVPKFTPYLKSTLKEGRLEMTVKEIDPSVTFTRYQFSRFR